MIADHLPRYNEAHAGHHPTKQKILQSIVTSGHETAWMELSGKNIHGQTWTDRWVYCECDFTEGIGWKFMDDGHVGHMDPIFKCPYRQEALSNRRAQLQREYTLKYRDLKDHLADIVLDLMKKGEEGVFLGEDGPGAHDYFGYFYSGTLSKITGIPEEELWDTLYGMEAAGLLRMYVAIIQPVGRPAYPKVSD